MVPDGPAPLGPARTTANGRTDGGGNRPQRSWALRSGEDALFRARGGAPRTPPACRAGEAANPWHAVQFSNCCRFLRTRFTETSGRYDSGVLLVLYQQPDALSLPGITAVVKRYGVCCWNKSANWEVGMGEQTPRYHRIADDLRGQIERGELEPGQQLKTEFELVEQYAASRNTVRLALRRLTDEGLIIAGQGRGSFVRRRLTPAVWDWSVLESRERHQSASNGDQWASIVAESGRQPRQEVKVSIRRPPHGCGTEAATGP